MVFGIDVGLKSTQNVKIGSTFSRRDSHNKQTNMAQNNLYLPVFINVILAFNYIVGENT